MNLTNFSVSEDKRDGVWLDFEDAQFLVAYAHRPEFNRATARIQKRYPSHKLKADPALYQRMSIEIIADCILLDWKNVFEGTTTLPCTLENKVRLLEIEPFREWISNEARELANFKAEALAEDAAAVKSSNPMAAPMGGE
jgi:hypothetical protein